MSCLMWDYHRKKSMTSLQLKTLMNMEPIFFGKRKSRFSVWDGTKSLRNKHLFLRKLCLCCPCQLTLSLVWCNSLDPIFQFTPIYWLDSHSWTVRQEKFPDDRERETNRLPGTKKDRTSLGKHQFLPRQNAFSGFPSLIGMGRSYHPWKIGGIQPLVKVKHMKFLTWICLYTN